jgi:hypothetical protein
VREFEIIRERHGQALRVLVCKRAEDDPDVWDRINEFPATKRGVQDARAELYRLMRLDQALEREP